MSFLGHYFLNLPFLGDFFNMWHFGLINRNKLFEPYFCLKQETTEKLMTLLTLQSLYLHNVQL